MEDWVCHSLYLMWKNSVAVYGEQDRDQSFSDTFSALFQTANMKQSIIFVLILSMRITTATPRFLGKWRPVSQTLRALTRWPENQSTLRTRFVSCTPHYLLHIENTCICLLYWQGKTSTCSHKIERQTKEQRGQWKRLAKTEIWHNRKKIIHAFPAIFTRYYSTLVNSVFIL